MKPRNIILSLSIVALVVVAGISIYALIKRNTGDGLPALNSFSMGGPFELVDHNGDLTSSKKFAGKLLLVQFGYTYCPDICPTELQKMSLVLDLLQADGEKVQGIFITVDPERDTTDVLADYVGAFHEDLVGFTGTSEQIRDVARLFRVYYAKAEPDEDGDYLMSHSAFTYLMDGRGNFLRHFTTKDTPEYVAEQIRAAL